ncbi:hypothetical protein [Rhodomicrobium udaipurense]|uniref:DUF1828 domain-containing protein n=1 Tax=Rhodomicrobium udaipurense TaxID=1202716 RepID=A0A8I1KJ08_9HYPH|nr:hypothetical protein [Rhodomicrobium udaipurense]MBJ7542336.1 hypothetical protein [Rhodomicrobium udaipurense]
MNVAELVKCELAKWPQPMVEGNTVVVATHCLYPSRTVVTAFIDSGPKTAVVSDGGGAISEARNLPDNPEKLISTLRKQVGAWGLNVGKNGWIYSCSIPIEDVAAMVAVVASASRDAAKALVTMFRAKSQPDWTGGLDRILRNEFGANVKREVKISGESNKTHKFDFVVRLPSRDRLVIDTVKPEAGSINSAIVHHIDLRQSGQKGLVQRIVFNDLEDWNSADLALLEVGAQPVALSKAQHVFQKLAA